jgi:hypothetical protein
MKSPREVLVAALEDVEATSVPEDLRVTAFSKVFDLHSNGAAPQMSNSGAGHSARPGGAAAALDTGDPLDAIGTRLQIARETVAEVFDIRDGKVQLIIPPGKLSSKVATATKEIALLVAGGGQAAGVEEWTSMDSIREVCSDFKKLDQGNFAKTVRSMEDLFNFRKESERKTSVKLARPGWEALPELVRRLGGEA